MGRIRTLKPEFPQSETIGRLSRDARLLFIQLWTIVDDDGRARASSRMLASLLYPYDDDARGLIDEWLEDLEREGCVRRYVVDGSQYLDLPTWLKHQKIDHPSKSKLPAFEDGLAKSREVSRSLAPDLGSVPRISTKDQDISASRSSTADAIDAPQAELIDFPKAEALSPQNKRLEKRESDYELLDRISDRWNAWADKHRSPRITRLTDQRAVHCRRRIADLMQEGFATPEEAFDALLTKCTASFYARGSPRKPLAFDQLMAEGFMTKMMEGTYEFNPNGAGAQSWRK